jgi:hypothetical protein
MLELPRAGRQLRACNRKPNMLKMIRPRAKKFSSSDSGNRRN